MNNKKQLIEKLKLLIESHKDCLSVEEILAVQNTIAILEQKGTLKQVINEIAKFGIRVGLDQGFEGWFDKILD